MVVDGAGPWTRYLQARSCRSRGPRSRRSAIFSFLASWDEFVWALTVINDPNKRTLPIAIALFQGEHSTSWGLVFAASSIAVVPVLLVFVDLPAAVRQRPDDGSAEGLMAIATGDQITEREPRRCCATGQSRERRVRREPELPRLPVRLAARRRVLRARARPRRPRGGVGRVAPLGAGGDRARTGRARGGARAARERRDAAGRRRCCPRATRSTARSRARIRSIRGRTSRSTATACGCGRSSSTSPAARPTPRSCARSSSSARYLAASWRLPCWSCWEEFNGGEHASTLGIRLRRARRRRAAARRRPRSPTAAERVRARAAARAMSPAATSGCRRATRASTRASCGSAFRSASSPRDDPLVVATVDEVKRQLDRPERRRLPLPRRHLLRRRRVAAAHLVARLARERRRQRRDGARRCAGGCARRRATTATCRSR